MAFYDLMQTPLGTLFVGGSDEGYHRFEFIEPDVPRQSLDRVRARLDRDAGEPAHRDAARAAVAVQQFTEYFACERSQFDLRLAPRGTSFQRQVWAQLSAIPAGETRSYGQVATALGQPSASRAVGAANGQNPLIIVVPCHRVIGADGSLTGYGAGIERKRWLLDREARWLPLFAAHETIRQTAPA
ncbi:MAG: methylated-DNA--[protein]-cysteine S-methyltransferase [Chloroflexi bacterium]|nr:methylated-DNA--[protein]-cysteine S-methyltransferase [Chloroflexota bacterium]